MTWWFFSCQCPCLNIPIGKQAKEYPNLERNLTTYKLYQDQYHTSNLQKEEISTQFSIFIIYWLCCRYNYALVNLICNIWHFSSICKHLVEYIYIYIYINLFPNYPSWLCIWICDHRSSKWISLTYNANEVVPLPTSKTTVSKI